MKHTSMSAVIVPFKIRLCIHIAMLQYHITFAKIISQCPQQYHIIQILVHSQLVGLTTILQAGHKEAMTITPYPLRITHLQPPWRQQR